MCHGFEQIIQNKAKTWDDLLENKALIALEKNNTMQVSPEKSLVLN